MKGPSSPEGMAMRLTVREYDPQCLGSGMITFLGEDPGKRQHFVFIEDERGSRATDEANQDMNTTCHPSVIDILTPYNSLKKAERFQREF